MALSDLVLPTYTLKVGKSSVELRGICMDDVSFLVANYKKEVEMLVAGGKALSDQQLQDDAAIRGFLTTLVKELPALVAGIIACASDDTSERAVAIARRLALPVSLEAMTEICRLTFEEYGGVKKFADALSSLVGSATTNLPS